MYLCIHVTMSSHGVTYMLKHIICLYLHILLYSNPTRLYDSVYKTHGYTELNNLAITHASTGCSFNSQYPAVETAYIFLYIYMCFDMISHLLQAYTEGKDCGQCKPGYFYPQKSNPQGCLSCYCMGITDQCTSLKNYYRDQVSICYKPHSHCFR